MDNQLIVLVVSVVCSLFLSIVLGLFDKAGHELNFGGCVMILIVNIFWVAFIAYNLVLVGGYFIDPLGTIFALAQAVLMFIVRIFVAKI
jgi:hypothetical protein